MKKKECSASLQAVDRRHHYRRLWRVLSSQGRGGATPCSSARAFERLAPGRQATLPPMHPEFHALATCLNEVSLGDDDEATP